MATTTKLNMKGITNLAKRLQNLARTEVKVGVFDNAKYPDGVSVAQVAAYNEYGTRFHPERPFMAETFADSGVRAKIVAIIKQAVISAMKGKGASRRILETLGRYAADQVKMTIQSYPGSNSPSTIARKGFDRPLYESGLMLESMTFKIGFAGSTQ